MTEKRFTLKGLVEGVPNIADKGKIIEQEDAVQLLNNQDERIQELEERNKRQYNRLEQLGDLMLKRDWKTLNNMVDDWEKQEELLQAEWGTYCEDK